jgi:Fe-S-cluster-containing hydrogenase component 2
MMKIKVDKGLCSGCCICEMICSLFHTGRINPERSAIRVHKDDLGKGFMEPKVCLRCSRMKCIQGEGMEEERETERFVWDAKRAEKCPFGALPVFGGAAYHCDLCGGDPKCATVCTPGAIRIEPEKRRRPDKTD